MPGLPSRPSVGRQRQPGIAAFGRVVAQALLVSAWASRNVFYQHLHAHLGAGLFRAATGALPILPGLSATAA